MNCTDYQDQMAALIDARHDDQELLQLNEHLIGCKPCQQHFREWQQLMTDLKGIGGEQPPADLSDRIKQSIRSEPIHDQSKDSGEGDPALSLFVRLGAFRTAAAAAAVVFAVWLVWNEKTPRKTKTPEQSLTVAESEAPILKEQHEVGRVEAEAAASVDVVEGLSILTQRAHPSVHSQVADFLKQDHQLGSLRGNVERLGANGVGEAALSAKVAEILKSGITTPAKPSAKATADQPPPQAAVRGLKKSRALNSSRRGVPKAMSRSTGGGMPAAPASPRVVLLKSIADIEKLQSLCKASKRNLKGPTVAKTITVVGPRHWSISLSATAAAELESAAIKMGGLRIIEVPTGSKLPGSDGSPEGRTPKGAPVVSSSRGRIVLHFLVPQR